MKNYSLRFKRHINEVFIIKPNDLGMNFLTFWFKRTTFLLKKFPFLYLFPVASMIVLLMYFLLGKYLILLTNWLQYGF